MGRQSQADSGRESHARGFQFPLRCDSLPTYTSEFNSRHPRSPVGRRVRFPGKADSCFSSKAVPKPLLQAGLLALAVPPGAALQLVLAGAAQERVLALLAVELVVAHAALQGVLAGAAADHIVSGEPRELVVAPEADDHVLAGCALADVGAVGADDGRWL